jgi:hypothetical protein
MIADLFEDLYVTNKVCLLLIIMKREIEKQMYGLFYVDVYFHPNAIYLLSRDKNESQTENLYMSVGVMKH